MTGRRRRYHCLLPLLQVLALWTATSRADSIWERRDQRSAFLFTDTRARQVGDLLTVVIRESTDIDQREKRALDKKHETSGVFNFKGKITGNISSKSAAADFNAFSDSQRKFDGKAEYTSEREFVDRITVTVVDVFPNGNILIEGSRRRLVSGEERTLHVSGIVRPQDIGLGNVIESRFISNFQVRYEGKGAESRFVNQGWFSRMVNHVWPF